MLGKTWMAWWSRCLWVAILTAESFSFASPSARSYLPVTEDLSIFVWQKYRVRIEPGLYLTDQWKAKEVAELRKKRFEDEVRDASLTYLRDNETVQDLYRGEAWKGTDAEFAARLGWIDRTDTPARLSQLWLEKPNRERWLLYEHSYGKFRAEGSSPTRVMGLPRHFLSTESGTIGFSKKWWLWYRKSGGLLTNQFEFPLKAYARAFKLPDGSTRELPLVHYSASQKKLLVAVWPSEPKLQEGAALPEEVDIVSLDLETGRARKIPIALQWPFLLNGEGIWYVRHDDVRQSQELIFRRLNWSTLKLAKVKPVYEVSPHRGEFRFLPDRFWFAEVDPLTKRKLGDFIFTPEGEKVPLRVPDKSFLSLRDPGLIDSLKAFDQAFQRAEELLGSLRKGTNEPRAYDSQINSDLALALGQDSKTWANVVYEEGQFVEDSVRSFFWGVDTGHLDVGASLRNLEAVFSFNWSELFGRPADSDLKDLLERARKVIDGTRAVLFLRDFPVREGQQVATPQAQANLQLMSTVFGKCLQAGTCRIVTTMRAPIYETLSQKYPAIFALSEKLVQPEMDENHRYSVSRILTIPLQESKGMVFSKAGFHRALQWCSVVRKEAKGTSLATPGYEEEFFRTLFEKAAAARARSPDENLTSIGAEFIKRLEQGGSVAGSISALRNLDFAKLNAFLKRHTAGKGHHLVIDQITDALETQLQGTRPTSEGPPAFILVGKSGVGKTHLALLVSRYLAARGDEEKAINMEDEDAILFDMGFNADQPFKIDPKSAGFKKLKSAPYGSIVTFDDIDKAKNESSFSVLAQILDRGYYAKGGADEINFGKVGAVFLTTTWGSQLIEDLLKGGTFKEKFQEFIFQDPQGPRLDEELKGKFSSYVYALPNLRDWDLLEVAFMYSRIQNVRYAIREGIQVRIDPALFPSFVQVAHDQKNQARDVVKAILHAFPVVGKQMRIEGTSRILLTRSKTGTYIAKTEGDADFEERWADVLATYKAYESSGIRSYLDRLAVESTHPKFRSLAAEKKKFDENPEEAP